MPRWLDTVLFATGCVTFLSCGSTPTEPSTPQRNPGLLVVKVSQPCSLPGTAEVVLQGGPSAPVAMPGETRLSVAPGRYSFYFRRGTDVFARAGSAGILEITEGSTTTLTNPPECCMSAPQ